MRYSFLFPGQGAQTPGMGKDLFDFSSEVRDLFRLASSSCGFDVAELVFEGSEEDLKATDNTQIAITVTNLAAAVVLREFGIKSDRLAGFSLGEYAALVEAGVLDPESVFPVVRARGQLMEQASRAHDSAEGPAGMTAVLGLEYETVISVLEQIAGAYPGIHNSPLQTVVSGSAAALVAAESALKAAGARRVVRLKVSGPFHSPLMVDARNGLEKELAGIEFRDPRKPIYSNVTAKPLKSGEELKRSCIEQLVSPVQWVATMNRMVADEVAGFLEVGPGTVLGGLWNAWLKAHPEVMLQCTPVGTLEQIKTLVSLESSRSVVSA